MNDDRQGGNLYEFTPNGQTYLLMEVIIVTHPPTASKGNNILGKTDPWSLRKNGNLEWIFGSIGPDFLLAKYFLRGKCVQNNPQYQRTV